MEFAAVVPKQHSALHWDVYSIPYYSFLRRAHTLSDIHIRYYQLLRQSSKRLRASSIRNTKCDGKCITHAVRTVG